MATGVPVLTCAFSGACDRPCAFASARECCAARARVAGFAGGPLTAVACRVFAMLLDPPERAEQSCADIKRDFGAMLDELIAPERELSQQAKMAESKLQHRRAVVDELVSTEQEYLECLRALVNCWQIEIAKAVVLTQQEISLVFANIPQMVLLATELVEDLTKAKDMPQEEQLIGLSFLKRVPFFRIYIEYTASRETAAEVLAVAKKNHKFAALLDKTREKPQLKGLGLDDFLIMPAQRIAKYPLLLRDLINDTTPTHKDYANLLQASQEMFRVLNDVNDETKNRQTVQVISKLQPNLIWRREAYDLLESKVQLVVGGAMKSTIQWEDCVEKGDEAFVFDICLLVCKYHQGKWEEVILLPLLNTILENADDVSLPFTVRSTTYSNLLVVFQPQDRKTRQHWVYVYLEARAALAQSPTIKALVPAKQTPQTPRHVRRCSSMLSFGKRSRDRDLSPSPVPDLPPPLVPADAVTASSASAEPYPQCAGESLSLPPSPRQLPSPMASPDVYAYRRHRHRSGKRRKDKDNTSLPTASPPHTPPSTPPPPELLEQQKDKDRDADIAPPPSPPPDAVQQEQEQEQQQQQQQQQQQGQAHDEDAPKIVTMQPLPLECTDDKPVTPRSPCTTPRSLNLTLATPPLRPATPKTGVLVQQIMSQLSSSAVVTSVASSSSHNAQAELRRIRAKSNAFVNLKPGELLKCKNCAQMVKPKGVFCPNCGNPCAVLM
eukprot:TRINITY_DN5244_c1_g1_i1.p1 TRINITY_DN5244_c1_g1~~TRINITY_DN5244_c1_g1_i1.p1  ORF type:complete len:732 (+),score=211.68 TRINITY_DN5244_c1_g1_i1:31-2196(+)